MVQAHLISEGVGVGIRIMKACVKTCLFRMVIFLLRRIQLNQTRSGGQLQFAPHLSVSAVRATLASASLLTGAWQLVALHMNATPPPSTPLFPHDCCMIAALLRYCNLKPQHNWCRGSSGTAQDAFGGGGGGGFFNGERKTPVACWYALHSFHPSSQFT